MPCAFAPGLGVGGPSSNGLKRILAKIRFGDDGSYIPLIGLRVPHAVSGVFLLPCGILLAQVVLPACLVWLAERLLRRRACSTGLVCSTSLVVGGTLATEVLVTGIIVRLLSGSASLVLITHVGAVVFGAVLGVGELLESLTNAAEDIGICYTGLVGVMRLSEFTECLLDGISGSAKLETEVRVVVFESVSGHRERY